MKKKPWVLQTKEEVKAHHDQTLREIGAMIMVIKATQEMKAKAIGHLERAGVGKKFIEAYKADMRGY